MSDIRRHPLGLDAYMAAQARRNTALAQAERHGPAWSAAAYAAIEQIARDHPTVHIDDVLGAAVPPPHHPNAWGAVWMRAIRAGLITRTAQMRPCKADRKKHAHQYPVYRSLVWRTA